jgi:hypothetical protein
MFVVEVVQCELFRDRGSSGPATATPLDYGRIVFIIFFLTSITMLNRLLILILCGLMMTYGFYYIGYWFIKFTDNELPEKGILTFWFCGFIVSVVTSIETYLVAGLIVLAYKWVTTGRID